MDECGSSHGKISYQHGLETQSSNVRYVKRNRTSFNIAKLKKVMMTIKKVDHPVILKHININRGNNSSDG